LAGNSEVEEKHKRDKENKMKARIKTLCVLVSFIGSVIFLQACSDSTSPTANEPSASTSKSEKAAPVARADAYAHMLAVPTELPDDPGAPMLVMMMEKSVVPSTSEVNVPVYPGAKIMTAIGPVEMTSNGEKMITYPSLAMLSADETADVMAFYQKRLPRWKHHDFYGSHSFWNGPEDSNPLDITGRFSLVSVVPLSESDSAREMWPEMRTRIDVRYEP